MVSALVLFFRHGGRTYSPSAASRPGFVALSARRLTSLCLSKREVSKRKDTPVPRPPHVPVLRVRASAPGFLDGTSMYRRETRALPARDPSGFPPPPRRGTGAPRARASCAQKQEQEQSKSEARFCAQGRAPLSPGPLGRGEAGSESPAGARAGSARVFAGTWTYRRKPRPRLTHPGGQEPGRARPRGVLSLAHLALDKQRKVGRRPLRATKPATAPLKASVSARRGGERKHHSRSRWIPACAGTTSSADETATTPPAAQATHPKVVVATPPLRR
jgi:hypothetical protein